MDKRHEKGTGEGTGSSGPFFAGTGTSGESHGYTRSGLIMGAMMILAGFTVLAFNFSFAITSLAWGSIIASLSLYFRHRSLERMQNSKQLEIAEESRRHIAEHKARIVEAALSRLPAEIPPDQLLGVVDSIGGERDLSAEHDTPEDGHSESSERMRENLRRRM